MLGINDSLRTAALDPSLAMANMMAEQQSILFDSIAASFRGILSAIQDQDGYQRALRAYDAGMEDYRRALEEAQRQVILQASTQQSQQAEQAAASKVREQAGRLESDVVAALQKLQQAIATAAAESRISLASKSLLAAARSALQVAAGLGEGEKPTAAQAATLRAEIATAIADAASAKSFADGMPLSAEEKAFANQLVQMAEQARVATEKLIAEGDTAAPLVNERLSQVESLHATVQAGDTRSATLRTLQDSRASLQAILLATQQYRNGAALNPGLDVLRTNPEASSQQP